MLIAALGQGLQGASKGSHPEGNPFGGQVPAPTPIHFNPNAAPPPATPFAQHAPQPVQPQAPAQVQPNPVDQTGGASGRAANFASQNPTPSPSLQSAMMNLQAANTLAATQQDQRLAQSSQALGAQRQPQANLRELMNQIQQDTAAEQARQNPNYQAANADLAKLSPQAQQVGADTENYVNQNQNVPYAVLADQRPGSVGYFPT